MEGSAGLRQARSRWQATLRNRLRPLGGARQQRQFCRAGGLRRMGARSRSAVRATGQRWHPFYDAVKELWHYCSPRAQTDCALLPRPVSLPLRRSPMSGDPHPPPPHLGLPEARKIAFLGPSRPRKNSTWRRLRGRAIPRTRCVASPVRGSRARCRCYDQFEFRPEPAFWQGLKARIETEIAEQPDKPSVSRPRRARRRNLRYPRPEGLVPCRSQKALRRGPFFREPQRSADGQPPLRVAVRVLLLYLPPRSRLMAATRPLVAGSRRAAVWLGRNLRSASVTILLPMAESPVS